MAYRCSDCLDWFQGKPDLTVGGLRFCKDCGPARCADCGHRAADQGYLNDADQPICRACDAKLREAEMKNNQKSLF